MKLTILSRIKETLASMRSWAAGLYNGLLSIRLPRISLPSVTLPRMRVPKLPPLKLPRLTLPVMAWSRIKLPKLTWPTWKKPRIKMILGMRHVALGIIILLCIFTWAVANNGVIASGISSFNFVKNEKAEEPFMLVVNLPDGLNAIAPSSGAEEDDADNNRRRYPIEQNAIDVEAVLIPRDTTVISSSRDSKIKAVHFDNGETFKKGDILVEYACKDAKAEVEIAEIQQDLTKKKSATSYKLFKLDIISDLEKYELETENKQAAARAELYKTRMEECFIRAEYDGRVVKRLGNAGEFTRTDRVLMEVASLDYLKAEFLLPSKWLRWVNVGANIDITINETETTYDAEIKYIYGEVDPISQSVQLTAQLSPYKDPLLPGMSGLATIDLDAIQSQGIYGFLEQNLQHSRP